MKIDNKFIYLYCGYYLNQSMLFPRRFFLLDTNTKGSKFRLLLQITETESVYTKKYGIKRNIFRDEDNKLLWFGFYLYINKFTINFIINIMDHKKKGN